MKTGMSVMGDVTNPILVQEGGFSVPLLASFYYIIEDRRPDLDEMSAKEVLGYKFKTTISFRILWRSFNITVRSLRFPHIIQGI